MYYNNVFYKVFCGGTLISDKHVITSASCASYGVTYYVQLGDTILGNTMDVDYTKLTVVTQKFIHPGFDGSANNIAILEMSEPVALNQFPNIKLICLPNPGANFVESLATVKGWGQTNSNTNSQYIKFNSWLQEVQVTVFPDEECASIASSEICAGTLEGSEAPCYGEGDRGGPLVVSDPSNNYGLTLAGIIDKDVCNVVETYTKVSVFTDWINQIIGDAATCSPPP